jgi:hypothetical protein
MAQTDSQSQEPTITRVSDIFLHTFTTLEGEETGMSDEGINEKSTDMKQEKLAKSLYFVPGLIKVVVSLCNTTENKCSSAAVEAAD